MKSLLIVLFVFFGLTSHSQFAYINTYGGLQGEVGKDLVQTPDGGFFGIGSTSSDEDNNNSQVYLIKLDASLTFEWSKVYGDGNIESGQSILKTADDNYLFLANVIEDNDYQLKVYKIDINGDILWSESYGGADWDFGNDLIATADGYLIAGYTYSIGAGQKDAYLIKINNDGELQWEKAYGGEDNDSFNDLAIDNDGNIIAVGQSNSFTTEGYSEAYYSKISMIGDTIWTNTYSFNLTDTEANGVAVSPINTMIVGATYTENKAWQMYDMVIDDDGELLDYSEFGNAPDDFLSDVIFTDATYVVTGNTSSYGAGAFDAIVYFFNINADYLDGTTFGLIQNDKIYSAISSGTNEVTIIGDSESALNNSKDLMFININDLDTMPDGDSKIYEHFLDNTIDIDDVIIQKENILVVDYSTDQFNVRIKSSIDRLSIHDVTGKLVYTADKLKSGNDIAISNLRGFYILSAIKDDQKYVYQLLVR